MQVLIIGGDCLNSNGHSIGKWISIIYRYAQCYMTRELEPYNIGSGQFIFLGTLYREDGVHQETLAKKINIDKGTTARAIKKLEKEGYVVRKEDPEDRRAYKVFLTEKALEVKPEIFKILMNWTDILSKDLTRDEKEKVIELLQRMSKNAALFFKEKYEK